MIKKQGGRWCLFTKDGSRKLGCHDTEAEAQAQERAIEISKHARALHAHASGLIRTGTYRDHDYVVVPVVALVEGVIHAHNAPSPELVLAEEFGRAPQGWNGRPVMLGHPQRGGHQVSANEPSVLEAGQIGQVFNARVEGGKLKAEAWLDPVLVEKVQGASEMLEGMRGGEQVEVSVGVFVTENETRGALHGKTYTGIWKDITPDHLAFLTDGVIGACSIEMGCGAPRAARGEAMKKRHAGGPGSGNFGHAGRPGEVGGSAPGGGGDGDGSPGNEGGTTRSPADMREISRLTNDWQKARARLDRLESGTLKGSKDPDVRSEKRQQIFAKLKRIEDTAMQYSVFFDQNNSNSPAYDDNTGERLRGLEKMTLKEKFLALLESWQPSEPVDAEGHADYGESDQEVRDALQKALMAVEPGFLGVDSVYSDESVVVYASAPEGEVHLFSREYTLDDDGYPALADEREEVERVTKFELVSAAGEPFGGKKAPPFGKKKEGDAKTKQCPPGFTMVDGKCKKTAKTAEDRYAAGVVEKNGRYCHATADGKEMCHDTRAEAEAMLKTMRAAATGCGCGGTKTDPPATTLEANMTKKELVQKILARKKAQFVAADAAVLETFSEERLKALAEEPEPVDPPVEPEKKEPKPVPETPEQRRERLLSENPDIKQLITESAQRAAQRRGELITAMSATKQTVYTEDELKAMPLTDLEKIVKIAASATKPDYSGAGAPRAAASDEKAPPPPIDMVARIRAAREKKSA